MLQSFLSVETLSITRGVGHRANFQQRTATFRDQAASLLPVKLSIREAVKFLGTVDSPNELVKYSPNNYKLPVKSTPAPVNIMTWWETGSHAFITSSLQLFGTTNEHHSHLGLHPKHIEVDRSAAP